MAKNNLSKALRPLIEQTTCKIYAIFCVILVEEAGWNAEEAETFCELSQAMWQQVNEKNIDVFKWCKEKTGIDMKARCHE